MNVFFVCLCICYVIVCVLFQDRGSGGNDEVSSNESASVQGGGGDKASPLYLLQDFSLRTLMVRNHNSGKRQYFNCAGWIRTEVLVFFINILAV